MNINPRLIQNQSLKQTFNPKLIQMFNIFNISYADLVDHIKHEHDDNVFIEISQSDSLLNRVESKYSSTSDNSLNLSDLTPSIGFQSIREFAVSQLQYCPATSLQKKIITVLIDSLDDTGFILNWTTVSKHIQSSLSVSIPTIKRCLELLQEFEPDGIGARSLTECLGIQIKHMDLENDVLSSLLIKVVHNHLDDLANQNYESIAQSCDIPIDGVPPLANFIKTNLNPNPGAPFSHDTIIRYLTPSFKITYKNGTIVIDNLEIQKGISITLSETYLDTLNQKDIDKETKMFLTHKYNKAKDMITFINQRREMMESLLSFITKKQHLYFEKGPDFLIPLLQKDVASSLSLSPSSISRILSSKFCETPHGVIPLSVLCPRNYFGKTKEQFTRFIAHYLTLYPTLSDQKLSLLLKEKGINIARRTITKYRHELGLGSSYFKGRLT